MREDERDGYESLLEAIIGIDSADKRTKLLPKLRSLGLTVDEKIQCSRRLYEKLLDKMKASDDRDEKVFARKRMRALDVLTSVETARCIRLGEFPSIQASAFSNNASVFERTDLYRGNTHRGVLLSDGCYWSHGYHVNH